MDATSPFSPHPRFPPHSHSQAPAGERGDAAADVHGFCPVQGLMGHSPSSQFDEELRCLLGRRLRLAATILAGAHLVFLTRDLLFGSPRDIENPLVLVPFVGVTVSMIVLAGVLHLRHCLTLKKFRIIELLTFGLPAAFFMWIQHVEICGCPAESLPRLATEFPFSSVIPWILLIQIYGIFIPNTPRRAAVVTLLLAVMALGGIYAAGLRQPQVGAALAEGRLTSMVFVLGICVTAAVYGSHRVGRLARREFDARNVGVYTLRERLGAGGMGEVYLAEHRLLKRDCAIKVIRPDKAGDANSLARFESEVQAAARLTHPNTIEIYDYGHTEDGTFYYAMEYLPGMNLQDIVDRYGPMPPARVVYLLRQVCSALAEAHAAGLVHRDIKPGNIFAAERGGLYDFAKLLDFGLVKSLAPDEGSLKLTMEGAVVGSPLYATPEATSGDGEPDARGDIYSLGATAYFLLTGRPVFTGANAIKVLFAHASQTPVSPSALQPDIPAALELVVMKCLSKRPQERFADVDELADALTASCPTEWTQQEARRWWTETPTSESLPADPTTDAMTETLIAGVRG